MRDFKFKFLGTGTSSGIPVIGCDCAVCRSNDPKDNRLRTSAAIEWTDDSGKPRTLLIDTSPDLRQQALRFGVKRLDAILYTHNHVDHTFGLDEVRRYNALQGQAIDVYAESHTLSFLKRTFGHIFESEKNINQSFVATLIAWPLEVGKAIELHGVRFTPVRVLHGRLPIVGFRIEAMGASESPPSASILPLAYLTDVSAIPPETWKELKGLRTLVLDALRHRHHPTHLTLGQAVSIAHEVGAEKTYFVHMTHDLGHAETQKDLPEGMMLAWDGLELG
ncbi:MAG: MBL fold metallo-hydrolase [Phycisphaeraceae bacterium]|nr:MBL fold metallo-hydrolase [Phycisphaeraceae bacterium]